MYRYVGNNPINQNDSSGLCPEFQREQELVNQLKWAEDVLKWAKPGSPVYEAAKKQYEISLKALAAIQSAKATPLGVAGAYLTSEAGAAFATAPVATSALVIGTAAISFGAGYKLGEALNNTSIGGKIYSAVGEAMYNVSPGVFDSLAR